MDLGIYSIIKSVFLTNKSSNLFERFGQITFEVHKKANKTMVKQAVEKIWNVKVDKVCVVNVKGKAKRFGRRPFVSPGVRKAVVTLKKGHKIDLGGQFEVMGHHGKGGHQHNTSVGK